MKALTELDLMLEKEINFEMDRFPYPRLINNLFSTKVIKLMIRRLFGAEKMSSISCRVLDMTYTGKYILLQLYWRNSRCIHNAL
jgi:hypothetical protein